MNSYTHVFEDKKRIQFFGAHPDDIDAMFGGTIARLVEDEKEVSCVIVTNGARGSRENKVSLEELTQRRQVEQTHALTTLGVQTQNLFFLGFMDGEVDNNHATIERIVYAMRAFQPDIVCAHNPDSHFYPSQGTGKYYVNHRDHRYVGENVIDAVYPLSRDMSFYPEHIDQGLQICNIKHILLTGEGNHNSKIRITDKVDIKRRALLCHKSQFSDEVVDFIIEFGKDDDEYVERGMYMELAF